MNQRNLGKFYAIFGLLAFSVIIGIGLGNMIFANSFSLNLFELIAGPISLMEFVYGLRKMGEFD